jgi:hypothetical protein
MPKEYKIPVYIILMTLAYFGIYLFILFRKFNLSPISSVGKAINVYSAIIILLNFVFLLLYLIKYEAGRIGLIIVYGAQVFFSLILLLSIAFLKRSSVIIANIFRISTFDVYVLLPTFANSERSAILALLIFDIWFLVIIYQLSHKDVKEFIRTKTYPLVNTQKVSTLFIFAYAISLAVISLLIKL